MTTPWLRTITFGDAGGVSNGVVPLLWTAGGGLSNETVKDENEWYGSFSKDISGVTVSAAAVKNNVSGDYDTFTLKRSSFDGVSVTFPEKDNLNTKSISVNAFT